MTKIPQGRPPTPPHRCQWPQGCKNGAIGAHKLCKYHRQLLRDWIGSWGAA